MEKLLKLADHIEMLQPETFDFTIRGNPSCGCAVGHCETIFPDFINEGSYFGDAARYFGIGWKEAEELFTPDAFAVPWLQRDGCAVMLRNEATAKEVAQSIRAYVKFKQTNQPTEIQ